jgi:hypothetical protein
VREGCLAYHLWEKTQVKGISVLNAGEIIWSREERGWKGRMQKIAAYWRVIINTHG